MSFIGKQITINGVIYTPQSTDPSNPKEGQQFFSDGTIRAKGLWVYKDSNWSQVGSGVSDKSVYAQFDAEDQSTTGFTNISVSGSGAINEDNSYVVDSFPASIPAASLNERNKNKENSVEFQYTLASGTAKAVVKDQTLTVLEEVELEASATAQKVVLSYFVTGAMSSITLEFQDVSSATSLKIDDIIFSDDPFVYKNLVNSLYLEASGNAGESITANVTNIPFIEVADTFDSWDGSSFTAKQTGNYVVSGGIEQSVANSAFIYAWVNGAQKYLLRSAPSTDIKNFSGTMRLNAGDVLTFRADQAFNLSNNPRHHLNITAELETEHVITPAKTAPTETKTIGTDFTATGEITGLTFTDLVVGERYFISGGITFGGDGGGSQQRTNIIDIKNGATVLRKLTYQMNIASTDNITMSPSFEFTATDTELTFEVVSRVSANVKGGGTQTVVQLTKLNAQFLAAVPVQRTAYIKDVKPSGTNGGTFTSGSWQTRDLNTVEGDSAIASVSSNQFTLQAGEYEIEGFTQGFRCNGHTAKIRNITDASDVDSLIGTPESSLSGIGDSQSYSKFSGKLTITTTKVFELQHRCSTTRATDGFGIPNGFGVDEVFSVVKITKIK